MVGALGFAPALEQCAVDGRPVGDGSADFSVADGGFVCPDCARGRETSRLGDSDRRALESFVRVVGPTGDLSHASLSPRHAAAHRRLVTRFIRLHVAEGRELNALRFWEGLPWHATS